VLQQDVLVLLSMTIDEKEAIQTVLHLYGQPVSEFINLKISVCILAISILSLLSFLKDYRRDVTA